MNSPVPITINAFPGSRIIFESVENMHDDAYNLLQTPWSDETFVISQTSRCLGVKVKRTKLYPIANIKWDIPQFLSFPFDFKNVEIQFKSEENGLLFFVPPSQDSKISIRKLAGPEVMDCEALVELIQNDASSTQEISWRFAHDRRNFGPRDVFRTEYLPLERPPP